MSMGISLPQEDVVVENDEPIFGDTIGPGDIPEEFITKEEE